MKAPKFTTVMLIDDNEIDNLINQKIIEASGICKNILTHTSGRSGIEFLRNMEKLGDSVLGTLPEIIFLDIDMPLMDGFQFLEEFEKLSQQTKDYSKIIILTSSINPQDIGKSKKYEYVRQYFNKPLTQDGLKKLEI
jgi:CheY-like chemotaxis protein